MKTFARLVTWMLVVAVAAFALVTGLAGTVFLHDNADAAGAFMLACCACVLAAFGFDAIAGIAPEVGVDVMTDINRVRNWRRRRAWRALAAALAGQSTASSFRPTPYRGAA
jgi:hypothetical protein